MSYAPRNEVIRPPSKAPTFKTNSNPQTDYQRSSNSDYDSKNENPGVVTSDSLAAESIQEGGSFGGDAPTSYTNRASNQDIASATRLDPAPDAEARAASEEWSETSQLNAGRSLGYQDSGRGPTYNIPKSTDGIDPPQPGGRNLTEGGFDTGAANASYSTDIGGKRDPGRVALGQFEEQNESAAGGAGPKQSRVTNDGQFESLGGDTEA